MRAETLPFSVGQIGRVAPFHAQERTSSIRPTRFFKQFLSEAPIQPPTSLYVRIGDMRPLFTNCLEDVFSETHIQTLESLSSATGAKRGFESR